MQSALFINHDCAARNYESLHACIQMYKRSIYSCITIKCIRALTTVQLQPSSNFRQKCAKLATTLVTHYTKLEVTQVSKQQSSEACHCHQKQRAHNHRSTANPRTLAAGEGNSGRITAVVWSLIGTLDVGLSRNTARIKYETLRGREKEMSSMWAVKNACE